MNTKGIASLIGPLALVLLAAFVSGGCKGPETRSYEVSVKNDSLQPITLWLTKDGPVYEDGWKSPEDFAIESRNIPEITVQAVPPGKTASLGPIQGKFMPETHAILRVYLGAHNLTDLLSINRSDTDRKDYELDPGFNGFSIVDRDGNTVVQRQDRPMKMSTEK